MSNTNDSGIRMIVNSQFYCYVTDGTDAIKSILEMGMDKLKYMSADGIKNWIYGALDSAEEMVTWKKDTPLKKRISIYRKTMENITDRNNLVSFYMNILLSCEGMATLSGFGLANVQSKQGRMKAKGKLYVNPEKRSIYE